MGSTELRLELVPVAAEVGRVGTSRLPPSTLDLGRDGTREGHEQRRTPRRATRSAVAAALLAAVAGLGVGVASLVGSTSSERKAQEATVHGAQATRSTAAAARTGSTRKRAKRAKAAQPRRSARTTTAARTSTSATRSRTRRTETAGRLAPAVSHAAPRATTEGRPRPDSGYTAGGTHLLVDHTGKTITNFVVQARCAQGILLPPIPILRDGSFQFSGVIRAKPRTTAIINGRFVGDTDASVSMRFVAGGCNSGVVALTLRLS